MIRIKTINNEIVRPMETPDDLDKRKPRGDKLIPIAYANIYACAKKRTGKTSVVAKMLQNFVGPETKVHVFCSTVHIDPTYIALGKWFDKRNIAYYPSTSIRDEEGHDLLADILKEDEEWLLPPDDNTVPPGLLDLSPKKPKKRKKRSKYKELRRIFVFDDLSNEIRDSVSLKRLLKTNRHSQSKTIISSQHVNDLDPQSINQLDYVFLFRSHNDAKLAEIHQKLDLSIPVAMFIHIYKHCTRDPKSYNFLYIDRFEGYRCSFNKAIIIPDQ